VKNRDIIVKLYGPDKVVESIYQFFVTL